MGMQYTYSSSVGTYDFYKSFNYSWDTGRNQRPSTASDGVHLPQVKPWSYGQRS